jgi:GNAT superfamily N-acetyltransferase
MNTPAPVTLELVELHQVEDYVSPFAIDPDGFPSRWWDDWNRISDANFHTFTILDDGAEVARAEVLADPTRLAQADINPAIYQGSGLHRGMVDIDRIEVRADRRGQGIGRAAVDLIVDHYPGRDFFAFSVDADEFWVSIGWQRFPRRDGDPLYSTLFAYLSGRTPADC